MKHVLGMARPWADLEGARETKLELDYLRLVYAIKELRKAGDAAQGYLIVLSPDILNRVKQWELKYQAAECVQVVYGALSVSDMSKLRPGSASTTDELLAGLTGYGAGKSSNDIFGQAIGENALRKEILKQEPGVRETINESEFPFGIHWDFYGRTAVA